MKLSRNYMKNAEFKERQLWLDFACVASAAIEAVADSIDDFRRWFKKQYPVFRNIFVNKTGFLSDEFTRFKHDLND